MTLPWRSAKWSARRAADAYCDVIAALGVAAFMLPVGVTIWFSITNGWGLWDAGSAVLSMALLVSPVLVIALGVAERKGWARWCAFAALVALGVAELVVRLVDGDAMVLLGLVSLALGAAFLSSPVRECFAAPSPRTVGRFKRWGAASSAACAGIIALAVVSVEGDAVQRMLRQHRLEQDCEATGDGSACSNAARIKVQTATHISDVESGVSAFRRLCREENVRVACRWHTMARMRLHDDLLEEGVDPFRQRQAEVSLESCLAGDERGCLVAATFSASRQTAALVARSRELCRSGETFACRAWVLAAEEEELREARSSACDAGFLQDCAVLGRAAKALEPRAACRRGAGAACEMLLNGGELSLAELHAYELIASSPGGFANPAMIGAGAPAAPPSTAQECADGSAAACFAAGIAHLAAEKTEWRLAAPDRAKLDATLGVACGTGFDLACTVYAARLLDRPVAEHRDIDAANSLLDQACARGDERACWMHNFEAELRVDDFDGLRAASARACRVAPHSTNATNPCAVLAGIFSADIKATAWPIADRVAYGEARENCAERGDRWSCAQVAWLRMNDAGDALGQSFFATPTVGWDAGAIACSSGVRFGCESLATMPAMWKFPTPETEEEVRRNVCAKTGRLCDPAHP